MRRQNSNCKQDTSYLLFTNFSNRILDLQMKFLNVYLQVEINRIKWEKRLKTINIKNFLLMKRLANETNVSFMERRLTLKTVFWLQDIRNNRPKKWGENKGTMLHYLENKRTGKVLKLNGLHGPRAFVKSTNRRFGKPQKVFSLHRMWWFKICIRSVTQRTFCNFHEEQKTKEPNT